MLNLEWSNLVLTIINLLVFYLLMRKFLIGPVTAVMEKRKAMIQEEIESARAEKASAAQLKEEYQGMLAGAKDESVKLVEQARADAKQEYNRIVEDAGVQAGKIMKTARETIQAEREQTIRQIESEIAGLAMTAAEKIVEGKSSREADQSMYDQFLEKAGDAYDDSENQ